MVTEAQRPTPDYVSKRRAEFAGRAEFFSADSTIQLLINQWPDNTDRDQVLAKVLVLDSLYSTNVYYPAELAEHIVSLNIDAKLTAGHQACVEKIARLKSRPIRYLSFATKYCSFHNPISFHIYDSYIEKLLWAYQREFKFGAFKRDEMSNDYESFARILQSFVRAFSHQALTKKELDKFLWIEGMEQFPRSKEQ